MSQREYSIDCGETETNKGRTIQSEAEGCDINRMMATFQRTGQIPQSTKIPHYGDFSNVVDFIDAKNLVNEAEILFNSLPANVRTRFKNNPAEFLEFMNDEANKEEAEELGLIREPESDPEPTPSEPPETPEAPTAEPSA